ncbi:MAG: hypothetical protein RMJ56_05400 [Gemmataceae bacterium]|nr:hypothetical protein [Gemmata sp.]MDW8197024.1 hypothetical protein [Gemmataceae bacterium]
MSDALPGTGVVGMSRVYRAPAANRAVLSEPPWEILPELVAANQRRLNSGDVRMAGRTLREFRTAARREILELARHATDPSPSAACPSDDRPLLITGHQPELAHPGVWVKNFALNGLARKLAGVPLHLIVDNDTLKHTTLRLPVFRPGDANSVRLESLPFDSFSGEVPYEDRAILNDELFRSFPARAAKLWANWGYEPLLNTCWSHGQRVGEVFTRLRRGCESRWGCRNWELPVSRLSQTEAFAQFAQHILADLPRFRSVYNAAIRAYRAANGIRSANHPAPELAEDEAPFWVRQANGSRQRATRASDVRTLRPRALTLTLFVRLCVGDFFIHGIGGGKYDEVTDAIIRDYFGIDPPAYQVLSATLHLPLPGFAATTTDLSRAIRRLRDLQWNPQRCLTVEQCAEPNVRAILEQHAQLVAREPPWPDHTARREWFNALRQLKEKLRPWVADQWSAAQAQLTQLRNEVAANAILHRRDYAWVWYPEGLLREFLLSFQLGAGPLLNSG